jgi:hypothetical protein
MIKYGAIVLWGMILAICVDSLTDICMFKTWQYWLLLVSSSVLFGVFYLYD